ncbi:asparagine amidohydrolase [Cordyceps militaris]|uniref:Asparagine amidohydrolase n=1 Tax=Cordyceps militaris TaxID=73501 RepID=A0A2H4SIN8_CORMI|nr:asparagine amidohydrolase [Cordyceps militaris]
MRIGCLQIEPQPGAVDPKDKASRFLDRESIAAISKLDFLVLPKLAFLRSDFDPKKIKHYLEPAGGLGTRIWAQNAARKYNCHVVVGYPQMVDDYSAKYTRDPFFSSSIIVSRDVRNLANCPERTLNRESPIFSEIGFTESAVSVAQYTDLGDDEGSNAKERKAFVDHIRMSGINIAIFSMAYKSRREPHELYNKCDEDALSRWAAYLWPLVEAQLARKIVVVLCNRVGDAGDTIYAGTSTVLSISGGELFVHELMKAREQGILLVETCEDPKYKLVPAQRCQDGNFIVDTSQDLEYKLVLAQEGVEYDQEPEDNSGNSADSPQAGPPTPDTSYLGSDTAQRFSQKNRHTFDKVCIPSKHKALLAMGVRRVDRKPAQHTTATREPRPTLEIPKSPFKSPQEISVAEYRARAAAVSKFDVSATLVRPPEDSTPHPGGARQRGQGVSGSRGYMLRTLNHLATDAVAAEDPQTAISSSPQCWVGQWLTVAGNGSSTRQNLAFARTELLARPKAPQTGLGRSRPPANPTVLSNSDGSSRRNSPAFQRPTSPKSRNAKAPDSLKPWTSAANCGLIPILASPSIMTTASSQTGSDSARSRGRSRNQRQYSEEETRSSSRDSTCHGLLHRRERHGNDVDAARCGGGEKSQSTSGARPRDVPRSASLPAVRNGRARYAGAVLGGKARRSGSRSWPAPKLALQ